LVLRGEPLEKGSVWEKESNKESRGCGKKKGEFFQPFDGPTEGTQKREWGSTCGGGKWGVFEPEKKDCQGSHFGGKKKNRKTPRNFSSCQVKEKLERGGGS